MQEYLLYQRIKPRKYAVYGTLSPFPIPIKPFQEIIIDFITGLPPNVRRNTIYNAILIIIDRFTKIAKYILITKKVDTVNIAKLIYRFIFLAYGWPNSIVSDRGAVFISAFQGAVCYHTGIQRRLNIIFYSQINGQTERQNNILKQYLRTYCLAKQDNWYLLLDLAEFAYNCSEYSSIGIAPYKALYRYRPSVDINKIEPKKGEIPRIKERIELLRI